MQKLQKSLEAWESQDFGSAFKEEVRRMGVDSLPLQAGLSRSSHVSGSQYDVVVLNVAEEPQRILVKAGIFYQGIIAGCSCADDPTPVDEQTEYCVLQFDIDKQTAETAITLVED